MICDLIAVEERIIRKLLPVYRYYLCTCLAALYHASIALHQDRGLLGATGVSYIISPPIPKAIRPAAAHLPVAVGAAPVATIAVSSDALWAVDVGSWLMVGVLDISVTIELGIVVVGVDAGSVPVATIAVSSEALCAVDVGS